MVRVNSSINEKAQFYNSTVQYISREVVDYATKFGSLCARFVDMGAPVKTEVVNGLKNLFGFQGETIDVFDQAVFTLKYLGLHDKEGKKINISDPLTLTQRRSGFFLLFIMMVHPEQADTKFKNIHMAFMDGFQVGLDVYGIYDIIDTQIIKT